MKITDQNFSVTVAFRVPLSIRLAAERTAQSEGVNLSKVLREATINGLNLKQKVEVNRDGKIKV